MSLDILLDTDGDLYPTTRLGTGAEVAAQRCRVRLQMHKGEAIYDQAMGLPFVELLSVRPFDMAALLVLVQLQLATVPGVAAVEDLAGSQVVDAVTVTGTVRLDGGEAVPVSLTLGGGQAPNLSIASIGGSGRLR
jgi:hypothetical protein